MRLECANILKPAMVLNQSSNQMVDSARRPSLSL